MSLYSAPLHCIMFIVEPSPIVVLLAVDTHTHTRYSTVEATKSVLYIPRFVYPSSLQTTVASCRVHSLSHGGDHTPSFRHISTS